MDGISVKILKYLKPAWWFVLLVVLSVAVWTRRATDALLVTVWVILWMFPLVTEISVLGVSVKKEVERATAELKSEIADVRNAVMVQSSSQSNVYMAAAPPDETIEKYDFVKTFEDALKSPKPSLNDLGKGVDDRIKNLMILRYRLEQEVNRVYELAFPESKSKSRLFLHRLRQLHGAFMITDEVSRAAAEIYRIGSAAVHAQEISEKQYQFAAGLADRVLEEIAAAR